MSHDATFELRERLEASVVGRYAIERELGRGAMGTVFLARDLALERQVAIKVLPPEFAAQPDLRERFLRETRTAAGFSHPNIVPVHAVEQHDTQLFFVMGYVDGETLTQRVLRAGPLDAREVTRLLQEVAWALSYAHGRGVVHRDVKPDNILVERATGRTLVMDFGIARSATASGLTAVGEVIGTPQFMSPEQAAGEEVDGRSDLYSLGIVAFYAVTGRLPFVADSTAALLAMQLTRMPPPLAELRPDLPPALTSTMDRCLLKDPAARFPNGETLVDALESVRASQPEVPSAIRFLHLKTEATIRSAALVAVLAPLLLGRVRGDADRLGIITLLVGIFGAFLWQVTRGMRALAQQGFSFADFSAGLAAIASEREAVREQYRESVYAKRIRQHLRRPRLAAAAGSVALIAGAMMRREQFSWGHRLGYLGMAMLLAGLLLGALVLVSLVAAPGGRAPLEHAVRALWSGAVGRWLYALAVRGLAPASAAVGASQLSGVTGQFGASALVASLPRSVRRQLGGVSELVAQLGARFAQLEERDTVLTAAEAEARRAAPGALYGAVAETLAKEREALSAELAVARREIGEERLAVAAGLERVRLQLVRLRGGIGDVSDVKREAAALSTLVATDARPGEPADSTLHSR